MRRSSVLAIVLIFGLGTATVAQEGVSLQLLGGVHATLFPNSLEQLGYYSYDPADQSLFGIWPTVAVEVTGIDVAGVRVGAGAGFQPLFISRIVLSQLNPDDTTHTDLDLSLYGTAYAEFPAGPVDLLVGPVVRLHYWSWDYYYDSQIGSDTSDFDNGTFLSVGAVAGVTLSLDLGTDRALPVSVRLYPSFSYGFLMPIAVLAGITL